MPIKNLYLATIYLLNNIILFFLNFHPLNFAVDFIKLLMKKFLNIYNLQFWLLCLSSFLFFSSFNMIIPELPSYLTQLGGAEYKGLIISLFTLTAGLSRPFSGKLADTIGRLPVMVIGAVFSFACGLLYPFVAGVATFLLLRLFHGFSTGFKPTGTSAYVADLVPDNRRGEAMGMLGFFSALGTALGPVLGGEIVRHSVDFVFYTSSAFAILSVIILINMKETLQNKQRFSLSLLKIPPKEVLEPKVFRPSIAMLFSVFCFGVVLTITPDLSQYLEIENKGLFFLYFTLASLAVRFIAGKASDKFGREPVLVAATFVLTISMIMYGFTSTPFMLAASSVVFGLGVGGAIPAIYAWTIDLSDPNKRGRAFATMYISLEVGIGLGALLSGFTYANDPSNFSISYWMAAATSFVAFLYVLFNHQQRRKKMKIHNASLADLGKPAISARARGNDSG